MANGWRSEARSDARRVDGCRRVRVLCSFFCELGWLCRRVAVRVGSLWSASADASLPPHLVAPLLLGLAHAAV